MRVLFVSRENARRGPMAQALLAYLAPEMEAVSAGLTPAERVDPLVVAVLRERGIDLRNLAPTELSPQLVASADLTVAVGDLEETPLLPRGTDLEWDIPEVTDRSLEAFRQTRYHLEGLVLALIEDLEAFFRYQRRRGESGRSSSPPPRRRS